MQFLILITLVTVCLGYEGHTYRIKNATLTISDKTYMSFKEQWYASTTEISKVMADWMIMESITPITFETAIQQGVGFEYECEKVNTKERKEIWMV